MIIDFDVTQASTSHLQAHTLKDEMSLARLVDGFTSDNGGGNGSSKTGRSIGGNDYVTGIAFFLSMTAQVSDGIRHCFESNRFALLVGSKNNHF
jgi:hypothetical protein